MTPVHDPIANLLWSAWSELGIPGGGRVHQDVVIDPEPLVAATPHLARKDPRLLGLAFDWCRIHATRVSASRLAGIARTLPESAGTAFASFNGSLALHNVAWRPKGEPLDLQPGRSRIALPVERPALLAFRIRTIAGVSTRADVLTRLLFAPRTGTTAAELSPSGTTRRSTELVLNELTASGVVRVSGTPRKRRFALVEPRAFSKLVQVKKLEWWDWQRVFHLIFRTEELFDESDLSPRLRRVTASRIRKNVDPVAAALGIQGPPRLEQHDAPLDAMVEWGGRVLRKLGRG